MKTPQDTLNETIALLQVKQREELMVLKQQFYVTYESLKPINLLKKTFNEVALSTDLKKNILNNAVGSTIDFLSNKMLEGSPTNSIKRTLFSLLEVAINNIVAKYSDNIIESGERLLQKVSQSVKQ